MFPLVERMKLYIPLGVPLCKRQRHRRRRVPDAAAVLDGHSDAVNLKLII